MKHIIVVCQQIKTLIGNQIDYRMYSEDMTPISAIYECGKSYHLRQISSTFSLVRLNIKEHFENDLISMFPGGYEFQFKVANIYPEKYDLSIWEGFKLFNDSQISSIEKKSELKKALELKIKEYEGYLTNTMYQSDIEQNAVMVTLRELKYLNSICEYIELPAAPPHDH